MTKRRAGGLDPTTIFKVLDQHQVLYVVIGGYGATVHKIPVPRTSDIDITPDRNTDNLTKLTAALIQLKATNVVPEAWGGPAPPFYKDPAVLLGRRFWTLQTPHGDLDIAIAPDGYPNGYSDLIKNVEMCKATDTEGRDLGFSIPVASIRDIYNSKRLANRPKDAKSFKALAQAVYNKIHADKAHRQKQLSSNTPDTTHQTFRTCGAWMPLAKRRCTLKTSHKGKHR